MGYLLKISSIGNDEERQEQVSGLLPDVYQYMRENCKGYHQHLLRMLLFNIS